MFAYNSERDMRKRVIKEKFNIDYKNYEEEKKKEFKNLSPAEQLEYEIASKRYLELSKKEFCKIVQKNGKMAFEYGTLTEEEEKERRDCFSKTFGYDMLIEKRLKEKGIEMPEMPFFGHDCLINA